MEDEDEEHGQPVRSWSSPAPRTSRVSFATNPKAPVLPQPITARRSILRSTSQAVAAAAAAATEAATAADRARRNESTFVEAAPAEQPETTTKAAEEVESPYDDPYLGLGRPEGPLKAYSLDLVLSLINANQFHDDVPRCRVKIVFGAAGFVLGVAVSLWLVLLFIQLHKRPQLPVVSLFMQQLLRPLLFYVSPESIRQQQMEGEGNYFAYVLNYFVFFQLNLTNSNSYQGLPLGYDRIENVELPRQSTRSLVFETVSIGLRIPLDVGSMFLQDINFKNQYWIVVDIISRVRTSAVGGFKVASTFRYRCEAFATGSDIISRSCDLLSGDKGGTDVTGMKFYRTPDWFTYYNGSVYPAVMFGTPADYWDDRYNYLQRPVEDSRPPNWWVVYGYLYDPSTY